MSGLEHQYKLSLPARGIFLMPGTEVNARGDVLARLHRNG